MKRNTVIEAMIALVMFLGLSGCIGMQPLPLVARSGDTISLALGGTLIHETVPGDQITLNDLNITIQQDGITYPVKKRYLFRLYPDPTSEVANYVAYFSNTLVGQWSAVVDLAYSDGTPLPLVGNRQATIVVTTSKLKNNAYYNFEGSLNSIPVTILTGTGQSHNFNNTAYSNVTMLQPLPQLAISFSGNGSVAAVALDIDYDETVFTNAVSFKIKQDVSRSDIIFDQRIYSDNGNMKMRILLMMSQGTLSPTALKCFILWHPAYIASGKTVTPGTFDVTSAKFYNESGAPVTGINVVKTLLYQ